MTMERITALTQWVSRQPRRRLIGTSIALCTLTFLSLNVLATRALDGVRADVTQSQVWTLSDGTRSLLGNLDEPLHLRFYLSDALTEAAPQLSSYADRVRGLLETYDDLSDNISLEIVSPEPFSDEEDRAVGFGINRIALAGAAEPMFFGLAATNSTDGRANIPVFSPEREAWLEYDLTRVVAELGQSEKPRLALLDGLGLSGGPASGGAPQQSLALLQELYEVDLLSGDINEFPDGTRVVAVAHPQGLSDASLYALDQWVMGGGALMVFLDPHAETQAGPQGAPAQDTASDLEPLLDGWGINFDTSVAIADPRYALTTTRRVGGRDTQVGNPAWLRLDAQALDQETPALANLSAVVLTTAGHFTSDDEGPALTPLATLSPDAVLASSSDAADPFADPRALMANGTRPDQAPVAIARVSGALKSAFPDGKPEGSEWSEEHLAEVSDANVLLSGDADLLHDRNWIQQRRVFGTQVPQAFANNGDFLLNAVEQMAGGTALADLRGRAVDWRPLTRIESMEREAELHYRATEQALLDRIAETESALRELAPASNKQDPGKGAVLFNAEMVAESENLRADLLAARAELRQVQYDLRSDVEALQAGVTTLNVGIVPFLAAVMALFFALRRPKRPLPTLSDVDDQRHPSQGD